MIVRNEKCSSRIPCLANFVEVAAFCNHRVESWILHRNNLAELASMRERIDNAQRDAGLAQCSQQWPCRYCGHSEPPQGDNPEICSQCHNDRSIEIRRCCARCKTRETLRGDPEVAGVWYCDACRKHLGCLAYAFQ